MGLLAHVGEPIAPHDLLTAWSFEPLVLGGLIAITWLYGRGRRPGPDDAPRFRAFVLGLIALSLALVSPVDAAGASLASAHMVQHLLLSLVAAPAFVAARTATVALRGAPVPMKRAVAGAHSFPGADTGRALQRSPIAALVGVVAATWAWHARSPYEAALTSEPLHIAQHLSFFGTGLWLWSSFRHAAAPSRRPRYGEIVGTLFLNGLQTVFLAALMTFSTQVWYRPYLVSAPDWGLSALDDQRIAGMLMWFPTTMVGVVVALTVLHRWFAGLELRPPTDRTASDRTVDVATTEVV